MKLVACPRCHAQYDVAGIAAKTFPCRCGTTLENRPPAPRDAEVKRCGSCGARVTPLDDTCTYCGSEIVRDRRRLSLICPECYAANAERSRFCTACGVGFRPEELKAEGYEVPCPACEALMPARQVGGIPLNECASCQGLWVPGDHFNRLVSRALESRKKAEAEPVPGRAPRVKGANPFRQKVHYRKCPECAGFMQRRNFRKSSGVIIDVCRSHGTWLDADELERIAGFILSGGKTSKLLGPPRPESKGEASAAEAFARARIRMESAGTRRSGSFADLLRGILG